MKRTADPILYQIQRARAISEKRERATKPTPPVSAPPPDIPRPPVSRAEAPPADPAPEPAPEEIEEDPEIVPDPLIPIKEPPIIDAGGETGAIIDSSTGLDWLIRRK